MDNDKINKFIRDVTKVGSMSKSEVRRRLYEIIKQDRDSSNNDAQIVICKNEAMPIYPYKFYCSSCKKNIKNIIIK